jgi:hypothetical protein
MNKKLVAKPAGITIETCGQWTYTTSRHLGAWMLRPRSLSKTQAINYPKGVKSKLLREREDVHLRPLLCYLKPAAPL